MRLAQQRDLIDRDHAGLAALMYRIRQAIDAQDFSRTIDLLLELQELEEAHYAGEEALMVEAGFSMHADHRAQHAQLIDTLRSINHTLLAENCRSTSPCIAAHLEEALRHMHESDTKLWAHLERG